jgi:diguanylate cyclase (GGDEF)-like protein
MFDIDHFKKFNDTHGHDVGDLVLKLVAGTVQSALRDTDLLARYGGEKFAILVPQGDVHGACAIADRVRKRVENLSVETNGQSLRVTISVGLALSSDYEQAPDAERIVSDADKQLYLSKRSGRNTWSYMGRSGSPLDEPVCSV